MARNFATDKGLETKEYFVYFKFSNCIAGVKGPPDAADDLFGVSEDQMAARTSFRALYCMA